MNKQYLLSRYCFLLEINKKKVFYHSLLLDYVIAHKEEYSIDKDTISINEDTSLLKKLRDGNIIVGSKEKDDELLQLSREEIKEPYISTAYIFVTQNCNLACKYCFEKQSETQNSQQGVMTCETVETGIDFFSRLAKRNMGRFNEKKTVIFYGGEPFHNKKTLYYGIKKVHATVKEGSLPENTRIIVVTNGTLLNENDIRFLKDHDITLTFSLDGDKASSVNRVYPDMQTLAWEKATQSYIKCRQAGLNLNVACTLSPATIKNQEKTLDYFINKIKANNIGFNVILDNDIIQIDEDYDDSAAEFVTSSYHVLRKHHISENRTQRRIQIFAGKHPCLFDCNAAGGRQIAIAPNGEVGICHEHVMDKKHFVTNIHEDFNPAKSSKYMEWQKRSPLYMEDCQNCIAIGICGGGCVINTERKYGTIWKPDPRFCKQALSILNRIILETI
jgi:uncharacterized protein